MFNFLNKKIISLIKHQNIIILSAFLSIPNAFALEQNDKQWFAVNAQQSWGEKWYSFIFSQARFVDEAHPWQAILLEGGLGYKLTTDKSIWLGYRWTGRNPYNGFYQENRLFQQIIWNKKLNTSQRFISRTRLEEITLSNINQIGLRLRQRFALEINHAFFKDLFPFLYEEVFFQLNHPVYMPRTLIGENRLFLGFNLYLTKKTWWEIGYINQYQIKTPLQTQNQMSHILSFTYNFV
jgi:hypothetical protein